MNKLSMLAVLALVILFFIISSPWLTPSTINSIVASAIESSQEDMVDGCGMDCNGCGVKKVEKVAFGSIAKIEFACGLIPEDLPEYHEEARVFISFLGTVHQVGEKRIPNF
ncbi:hypothetical protein [Ammoniphilus sp. CFH 90114]|uniref:hypothetical protein n=1 Tax=Ammoniphilus sp. CFH 90114 TaxID=2493665 RepID=UPI00100EFBEA|nr:hypothetical protein [Ammoniphilus sp. CFH 90114]RXT06569.1 hypothetical protein EIZ39_16040 [Ammoniphilus sp. CFH 90114]